LIVSGRDQDKCPPRSFYNKHMRGSKVMQ